MASALVAAWSASTSSQQVAEADGQEEGCGADMTDHSKVTSQGSRGRRCHGMLATLCITATWCFCVHFGSVRACHFARDKGFSAFYLVQAWFQQHGAPQRDGTSGTRQAFVRAKRGRHSSFSRWKEGCQLSVILIQAFCWLYQWHACKTALKLTKHFNVTNLSLQSFHIIFIHFVYFIHWPQS